MRWRPPAPAASSAAIPALAASTWPARWFESTDARFREGDEVIATSYDIGVAHHGGYAEYGRVPADWVVPLPNGMSLFDSMALGTAGYTAALGVVRMEENGLKPANGRVIVSGATGGVGSIAVDILSGLATRSWR